MILNTFVNTVRLNHVDGPHKIAALILDRPDTP